MSLKEKLDVAIGTFRRLLTLEDEERFQYLVGIYKATIIRNEEKKIITEVLEKLGYNCGDVYV